MVIRKDLREEIEVPEGITTTLKKNQITMKNDNGELKRRLSPKIKIELIGNKIV